MFRIPSILLVTAGLALNVSGGSGLSSVPVLVELFTSEGCSSCPPADRLIAQLDKDQSVSGADVIVLSEHVDYWNHLGWADPFSSAFYSARQREYAGRLNGEVYTPEAVVDGARGLVGSDERELRDAIQSATKTAKVPLAISATRQGEEVAITVTGGAAKGSLFIALAYDSVESQVSRGENSGRRLGHVGVVYAMREMARLDGKSDLNRQFTLKAKDRSRVVAFVSAGGRIVAAGHTKV